MAEPASVTPRITFAHRDLSIACSLSAGDAAARVQEWHRLLETAGLGLEAIDGGMRLWLRTDSRSAAAELAGRESECCAFLDFDLVSDGGRLRLDVTSPVPEAEAVIEALLEGDGDVANECCPQCS